MRKVYQMSEGSQPEGSQPEGSQPQMTQKQKEGCGCIALVLVGLFALQSWWTNRAEENARYTKQETGRITKEKQVQKQNVDTFRRKMPGAHLIAFVEPDPENPHGIWIRLERTWDAETVKGQRISQNVWYNTWDNICKQTPAGKEPLKVTLYKPDGEWLDTLKPLEEAQQ
jgi:hypothetical protein